MPLSMKRAREWCEFAHGNQMYGEHPYSYHLEKTEEVALRFGFTSMRIRQGCWVHDIGEDTKFKQESDLIDAGFSPSVARISWCCADGPGKTRKERKAGAYAKIRTYRAALIVKLCDRIANIEENILTGNKRKFAMYRREFAEFQRQLRDRSDAQLEPMWLHLESLLSKKIGA